MHNVTRTILRLLYCVSFLALAGSLAAAFIPPDAVPGLQVMPVLDIGFFLLLLIVLFICAHFNHHPFWPAALLVMYVFLLIFRNAPKLNDFRFLSEKSENHLVLLSLNVQQFGNDTARVQEITRLINSIDPDVICLQEFGLYYKWPDVASVAADFSQRIHRPFYDFSPTRGNIFGTALFSRYPIVSIDTVFQLLSHTNEAKVYKVQCGADTVTICNVHLQSFNMAGQGEETVSYIEVFETQAGQCRQITRELDHMKKTAVAGDFNAVPGSWVYREFTSQFTDAPRQAGLGWIATHHLVPARIDHVFISPDLFADPVLVNCDFPSDHCAVMTTLKW